MSIINKGSKAESTPTKSGGRATSSSKGKMDAQRAAKIFAPKTAKKPAARAAAKKIVPPPPVEAKKAKKRRGISDGERYTYATVIVAISIILFRSIFSYFHCWMEDQSICSFDHLFSSSIVAANSAGKIGALLGNFLVGGLFGIFALLIPIIFVLLSLLLCRVKPLFCRKALVSSVFLLFIGAVASAFFGADSVGVFGSSLGGEWGLFVASFLENILGVDGTAVVIVMFIALWAGYTSMAVVKYLGKTIKAICLLFFAALKGVFAFLASLTARKTAPVAQKRTPEPEPQHSSEEDSEPVYEISDRDGVVIAEGLDDEEQPLPINPFEEQPPIFDDGKAIVINTSIDDLGDDDDFVIFDNSVDSADSVEGVVDRPSGELALDSDSKDTETKEEQEGSVEPLFEIEGDASLAVSSELGEQSEFDNGYTLASDIDDKFEISVTDSATIVADTLPDDVVVTTNEHHQVDSVDIEVYDPTLELSDYKLPSVDLLDVSSEKVVVTEQELYENKNKIVETLNNFNIAIDKIKATIGPTVTLYEIKPAAGVRISKIKNLEDDIALSLSALGIRIIAPIPGKGTIGIEVPNSSKETVSMHSVIKSTKFQESSYDLPIVLGRTIQNDDFVIDLAKMPHLLVAGATGQGKSVGLNAIITSLLYKKHPAELKFVLVDPKKVELNLYASLEKHFLAKMSGEEEAIITDTDKVIYTLNSLCIEMDARYMLLKNAKVRNIKEYNAKFISRRLNPNKGHRFLPYFVVIIDEFADLIMTAGREIETPIARIAQLARAVGIHLVIATQRPTTNIITGVIKANFPARIAFRVSSMIDSRTILDQPGANQLIGRGDMLVSTGNETIRVQCAFVDTPEVERITDFIGGQRGYSEAYELPEFEPEAKKSDVGSPMMTKVDEKFTEVARYVVQNQQGSASTIQRNFNIGFNRAGRLMDQLERAGIVGKQDGSKPRQVLISDMASLEVKLYDLENGND